MSFIVIVPARFYSTRFPGKPLAIIRGIPMIVRVMRQALKSDADKVIVATDHIDIVKAVEKEKTSVEVFLSEINHQSGIERIEEVINKYGFVDSQVIVNLQGDEPLISPNMINLVANDLLLSNDTNVSTLAVHVSSIEEKYDSNVVKVVVNINGDALYFSRSMIPWCNKELLFNFHDKSLKNFLLLRHIGIYSYCVNFIRLYNSWKISPLEELESLEQLRILWYGGKIHVSVINDHNCYISVDTPEELNKINEFLEI